MPVLFNEPLSFLQRLTENVAYIDLVEKANESEDSLDRIEVCFFIIFYQIQFKTDQKLLIFISFFSTI